MPGFDGTGPRGQGPMTGGARGYCALPVGEDGRQFGRGIIGVRGNGRGRRNCFYATGFPGWVRERDELDVLKGQADFLKKQLEDIQGRIETLEKVQAEKGK